VRIAERSTINSAILKFLEDGSFENDYIVFKNTHTFPTETEDFLPIFQDPEVLKLFEPENDPWDDDDESDDDEASNENNRTRQNTIESIFQIPNKTAIKNYVVGLICRLYPNINSNVEQAVEDLHENGESSEPPEKKSFREIMDDAIRNPKLNPTPSIPDAKNLGALVTNELNLFIKNKQRGFYLQKCYNALLTVKATSVESERAFSVAGYLCTKVRNRFKPDTLSMLCFLRQTFRNKNAFSSS